MAGLRLAFNEDKAVLEAIQRNEDKPRDWKPIRIALDGSSVRMRRRVDELVAAES
jgi:vanillate O-demethylase monooxygenase subunit